MSVSPRADQRHRGGEQLARAASIVGVSRGRLRDRVRARRAGEVVEAQPQHDRAADAIGLAQPPRDAVDQPTSDRVQLRGRVRAGDRARAASRSSAAGAPTCTGRGSRLWASACRCRPDARPSIGDQRRPRRAPRPARPSRCRARAACRAVTVPDAPQPLDRQRVQELQLPPARHDQQPVGLGDRAGDLGEELRASPRRP